MGAGLPSAVAAHLVYPDRPVISVCGERFHDEQPGLETAVRLGMHIPW
ncbi:thiamine pyrophosphate-dependent enzyme [Pseudomonas asiatica]|nr:thiamine pyrophosphate-dependent enzyme [Pseudomonas asiatica]